MIMGAGGRDLYALLWIEWEAIIRHALFTDLTSARGGMPTPHFFAMKKLMDNFPKGTLLYTVFIHSPDIEQDRISDMIEVLSSGKAAYVINKTNTRISVTLNGVSHYLSPYAVDTIHLD
jgi:hypothetical protein